jgi:hypothetical protein
LVAVLKFDSEIKKIELSKEKLLIYEEGQYHEVGWDLLKPIYGCPINNNKDFRQFQGVFNFDNLTPNTQYQISNKNDDIITNPFFFTHEDFLQICDFPFNQIVESFSSLNYKKHILNFSKFYFSKIKKTNYNDNLFGPMNPFVMCIYHNDSKLLEELLNTYRYPRSIEGEVTPLSYAFANHYISNTKLLCENLSQSEHRVDLSKRDFEYLLESPYGYCHKLMAMVPKPTDREVFPSLIKMGSHVRLFHVNNATECLLRIKQMESTSKRENFLRKIQNKPNKKDVVTYEVPFKYSFEAGSIGSINFLYNFSESNNEDFLLSQWKNLVIVKWTHQLSLQIMIAGVYWLFTLFVMVSMIFARDNREVKCVSIGLTIALFVFEILQCVSYCSFKVSV